jgi:DNA-binding beta-propeller fold protein YncE
MRKSLQSIFIALFAAVVFVSGCKKEDTDAPVAPLAATIKILTDVTSTTAISGGVNPYYYTSSSGAVANGVCWSSTNQAPTIADSKTSDTLAVTFQSKLTGLTPNTTYYLRAYVTSDSGTGYGGVITFKTATATSSTTATVSTFAGSTSGAFGFVNDNGTAALFNGPQAVSYNAAKTSLYVSDTYNNVIRTVSLTGLTNTLTNPTLGYLDGDKSIAQFYGSKGTATDAAGNTYVADAGNNVIRKITSAGIVSTFAGNGTAGYADGTGAIVKFNNPQSVAVDPASGNVYVADRNNHIIRKITPTGIVSTFAGLTTPGFTDGVGTAATFNQPVAVAVDASGNVYVADYKNLSIRKITSAGDVSTVGGGPLYPKLIGSPVGLAIDAAGSLFIADQTGRILKLINGNVLNVLAGAYNATGNVNGVGTAARFSSPQAICFDATGNLYVTDFGNNSIRKIAIVNVP